MTPDTLRLLATDWMNRDPDPLTREEIRTMLNSHDDEAIRSAFGARLQFGTAGLRGEMGAGPNRMNRLLVRRVGVGLARYLLTHAHDAPEQGVVVGYDGRHNSREFAEDTAAVLAARGFRVYLADRTVATPVLAFAVTDLGCCAGVMVTASHNPPKDNGYKVYWSNGAQIIPPHDTGISAAIDEVEEVGPVPQLDSVADRVVAIPEPVYDRYYSAIQALRVRPITGARIVYTAMHGVGLAFVAKALADAGHTDLHLVAEQVEPDGDFPTVAFPNPEEDGALDLALAFAEEVGADVIVANDPDADRLAAVVRAADGSMVQLTGNEVGLLLADELLEAGLAGDRQPMVATTIVSSAMLRRIAAHRGAVYAEALTGFKWIANKAIDHDAAGGQFVLGFEEALGYSAGSVVRDKDGVSAILLFADLVSGCKAAGETVLDRLDALYRRHGLYVSRQQSTKLPGEEGAARIRAVLAAFRADPPSELGGIAIEAVRDIQSGEGRSLTTGETWVIDLPSSNVLAYDLVDGSRVLLRPSGTEPKIKFYFEVRAEMADGEAISDARACADQTCEALMADVSARAGL